MNRDRHFERRMIVTKYSNRPPFDLKKPKEIDDITEKMKAYPEESCKNCCKNKSAQKRDPPKSNKSLPADSPEDSKIPPAKRIIPKIIKKFQKLTPAINLTENSTISQNASIQTLYRNTKPLGKNIPKHKLMKNLLQNFDSEKNASKHKSLHCKSGFKNKKNKKLFFNEGEMISPDIKVSRNLKRVPSTQDPNVYKPNMPQKVDKRTSTTGLLWPPKSKEMLQYSSLHIPSNQHVNRQSSHTCHKTDQARFGAKENRDLSEFCSESYLEELPTKDTCQPKINQLETNLSKKDFRCIKNEATDHRRQEISKRPVFQTKLKSEEKTFVQTQVEKLDKVLKNTKANNNAKFGNVNKKTTQMNLGRKHFATYGQGEVFEKEATANYIGLMNKIRTNCPQLEESANYHNVDSDHEWSDMKDTEVSPNKIRFPKETRIAINQCLSEKKQLPSSSRFMKVQESFRSTKEPSLRPVEVNSHTNPQGNYEGAFQPVKHKPIKCVDIRKSCLSHNRDTISLPCKKNLLCDKGDQHLGPCGYTHTRNKVVY